MVNLSKRALRHSDNTLQFSREAACYSCAGLSAYHITACQILIQESRQKYIERVTMLVAAIRLLRLVGVFPCTIELVERQGDSWDTTDPCTRKHGGERPVIAFNKKQYMVYASFILAMIIPTILQLIVLLNHYDGSWIQEQQETDFFLLCRHSSSFYLQIFLFHCPRTFMDHVSQTHEFGSWSGTI